MYDMKTSFPVIEMRVLGGYAVAITVLLALDEGEPVINTFDLCN